MRNDIPGIQSMKINTVDVRDVAEAHYLALTKPGISGMRFII